MSQPEASRIIHAVLTFIVRHLSQVNSAAFQTVCNAACDRFILFYLSTHSSSFMALVLLFQTAVPPRPSTPPRPQAAQQQTLAPPQLQGLRLSLVRRGRKSRRGRSWRRRGAAGGKVIVEIAISPYFYQTWFGFNTGRCEKECLKVQYTARQTFSMADSLTVGLTLH